MAGLFAAHGAVANYDGAEVALDLVGYGAAEAAAGFGGFVHGFHLISKLKTYAAHHTPRNSSK